MVLYGVRPAWLLKCCRRIHIAAGSAGGVRFKRIVLTPDHWDLQRVAAHPATAAQWFKNHEGALYDWQLILGFMSWLIPQKSERWTCSEACAAALGVPADDAWRFDPINLPMLQAHGCRRSTQKSHRGECEGVGTPKQTPPP